MKKIHELGTWQEKLSNAWLAFKRAIWVIPVLLLFAGAVYWVGINFDAYLFTTVHPDQVRIRKVVYDQSVATGSAAQHDYLQNH